jgi:hypothetical protein
LRSLPHLSRHLTARADDSHAVPALADVSCLTSTLTFQQELMLACQTLVRFFALHRIKPHAPPLVLVPVNSFEFQACARTTQAECLMGYLRHGVLHPTPSTHRLQPGLPGYLIRFAPLAFVPQRQEQAKQAASSLVFLPISTHFTATPGIPLFSSVLELSSISRFSDLESQALSTDLLSRLRTLYAQ